jgi:hypothetical protein
MKKHLLLGLLTLAGANSAFAIFQWDVDLSDLDAVACWNPNSCAPSAATVHMYNPANPAQTYTINCNIFGPSGQPLVYSFQADADAQVNCALTYIIDELWVSFDGPGFHFEFTHLPPIFSMFYGCGPLFPVNVDITGEELDGCVPFNPGLEWTFANFPGGQVALTEDFTVEAGELLHIEAGMEVYGLPGTSLIIQGDMEAQGTRGNWIRFVGEDWNGIVFGEGADADLTFCSITDVHSGDDGGAITVEDGGWVRLFNCLIAHNTCVGNGAAAYVADGGVLSVYNSTISHNHGTTSGGIFLGGANALFESGMNLITFATPANTDVTGVGFTNVFFTNIYPQNSGFPDDMVLPAWYCNPGYVNPMAMNFNVSYWSLSDPTEVNCIIDVSVSELEIDPDGTPADMGAFPYNQFQIMHPASILAVNDRPNDQGGYVVVQFAASPNDGSWMNPTTMYSVWMQYPGMGENEWVSAGTVAALGVPGMTYNVQVATLDDQYEGHENIHSFMIGTHSVHFPVPIPSAVMQGFSVDNIVPVMVTGLDDAGWAYDAWPPTEDRLPLSWNQNPVNDFDRFIVTSSLQNDINTGVPLYEGPQTSATFSLPFGQLVENQPVYFWAVAVDYHENRSDPANYVQFYTSVENRLPTAYSLGQNYPNPFNPTTSIEFALPVAGQVNLSVYNMLGAKVATLVNGQKAAGRYTVSFDGASLASGVYFYKLETPSFSDLKKMILVK